MMINYITMYYYYGPGPHWGTVRKRMSPGRVLCKSCVLRSIWVHNNDFL